MKFKNILFDLDGTLTDPQEGIIKSIHYALDKLNFSYDKNDDFIWCIGPPLRQSLKKILNSPSNEIIEKGMVYYRERFGKEGIFENRLIRGIPELLTGLKNFNLILATSKPTIYADRIIPHFKLDRFIKKIYGSEIDGVRTDKKDLIKFVIDSENLVPEETLMVGDREHDIIGPRQNSIGCIAVTWGYGAMEELEEANPEYMVSYPEEILDILVPSRGR